MLNEIQFELNNMKLGWLGKEQEMKERKLFFDMGKGKINTEISTEWNEYTGRLKIRGKNIQKNRRK